MAENGKFLELLAVLVASGMTIKSAASEIDCSESHAYRLSSSPEFRQRVATLRTEATSAAVGRLADASCLAVGTLVSLLADDHPPNVRCSAARAILSSVTQLAESLELRDRIDELERATTSTP